MADVLTFKGITLTGFPGAIGTAEGAGVVGSIPYMSNNPGDLKKGDVGYGTTPNGITIYPTPQAGVDALNKQVSKMTGGDSSIYNPNMSISQAGSIYSGSSSSNWADNVAKFLGTSTATTLGAIGGPLGSIAAQGVASATGGKDLTSPNVDTSTDGNSPWVVRGIAIAVGLLLFAAGIFSLDRTQQLIQTGAKAAKRGAEIFA